VECQLGCGTGGITAGGLVSHKSTECPLRSVQCVLQCGNSMAFQDIEAHVASSCPNSPATCQLGCATLGLQRKSIPGHLADDCPLRSIACPNDCGDSMQACLVEGHLDTQCPLRPARCRWEPSHVMLAKDMGEHECDCPSALIRCVMGCGATLKRSCMDAHMEDECPANLKNCPLCLNPRIPHYRLKSKVHQKEECPNRQVHCPLGCDALLIALEVDNHVAKVCRKRFEIRRYGDLSSPGK